MAAAWLLPMALSLLSLGPAPPAASAAATITPRGPAAVATYASDSTTALQLPVPVGTQAGDVLVASLGFGKTGAKSQPTLSPPAGWTLVSRTNKGAEGTLAVYRHVFAAGETSYTWTTNVTVGGTAFLEAFGGVDTTNPIDVSAGAVTSTRATAIPTPSVTTTAANAMLVASYFGYRGGGLGSSWTPPSGMTEIGDASNLSGSRSGSLDSAPQPTPGASGSKTATASVAQDYAVAALTALRPAAASSSDPPVISEVRAGSVTTRGATITWATDQPSDSQVEYGPTSSYGASTTPDSTMVTSHSQQLTGLTANTTYHFQVKSRNASGQLSVSDDFSFRTSSSGPVPLIVDTDIFSDADDVGALATAFGLQLRGEAKVIAVGVNTRQSRPAVATSSWKCAAAVTNFYNSGDVPIGTAMPNNGTEKNTVDFVGPCSKLAPASTPTPDTAVSVYRRALAGQADGSVVITEAGYYGNLSALLDSPADSISPLTGRELVARKVRTLVAMGGGYPSRNGENNFIGDPAAAQNVAQNWPTKIVWSGYEVGDEVHTGQTISRTHPSTSPVRVAYEAFVGPNNWIYSYDLTAVYHAIRPDDSLLSEAGPGTNAINDSGANTFTPGSGNQYYLVLSNPTALDSSIEALLDTLPGAPTGDTTPPTISGVGASSVSSSGATVSWSTNEPATSQVEYGTTTGYGSATALDGSLTAGHSQALSGLAPSTLYHYRVKSTDAAGNVAASPDFTFTTGSVATSQAGPSDSFDANTIDPARWTVTSAGSTVAAANQELEITHPAGGWTMGYIESATPYDQTGKVLQLQVKRAANAALGGSSFGETAIYLRADATHYVYFFAAGGSLTAWANSGSGEVNLTPSWPAYNATTMQWLRFRESAGRLYWEYASGTASPGTWTTLASAPDPFALRSVTLRIAAGSNVSATDTAKFDNVGTF